MQLLAPVFLLTAAVVLGILLGLGYLRRRRSNPVVVAFHLLLGLGGLETVALLLRGTPDGSAYSFGTAGKVAALLLVLAALSGLISPLLHRHWPRRVVSMTLATHACFAAAGFLVFLDAVLKIKG